MSLSSYGSSGGSESLAGGGAPNYIPSWAANLATYHNAFTPEQFGAQGNNPSHDDAPAIEAAIAAAVAAAQADGSNVCAVVFQAKTYYANRAPRANPTINGGVTYAYAQISLPFIPVTESGPWVTLYLVGTNPMLSDGIFQITGYPGVVGGAIIESTITGQSYSGTFGPPSVLGGNTYEQTPGPGFSNISVVVDNLAIITPVNPTVDGAYFLFSQKVNIGRFLVGTNGNSTTVVPTGIATGLVLPWNNNMNQIEIQHLMIAGYPTGLFYSEHVVAQSVYIGLCRVGLAPGAGGKPHGSHFERLSLENCQYGWASTNNSTGTVGSCGGTATPPTTIGRLDLESGFYSAFNPIYHVWDTNTPGFNLRGWFAWLNPISTLYQWPLLLNGGQNVSLQELTQTRGRMTAPALPATATAFQNPFACDAYVTISGGTVTNIQMGIGSNGALTSVGTSSFSGIVPSNAYLTLTYSAAPTWTWTTL